ncbi:MAG TPA: hypothetical protein PLF99_01905 [Tenuifilaceae bacterium]|nr:hypothetical protein [Tenuifilaceae bacterium]
MDNMTSPPTRTMGFIGIVLSAIAIGLATVPSFRLAAFIPGILAIVFSTISVFQASRNRNDMALCFASLGISLLVNIIIAVLTLISDGKGSAEGNTTDFSNRHHLFEMKEESKPDIEGDDKEKTTAKLDSLVEKLKSLENESVDNEQ